MEEAKEEKEMLDWLKGATIATLHAMSESIPTPTARLLKSTKTHPILSPIGLHEVGWKAEVAKLDGSSVGAIGPMIADTGAQFVCIPSNVAAKFVASGSTMFKATDGVIAQVSTDVEVEGIIYGDLVLHSPSGGTIVFKRMQCVVLPGDEILLSNWCLDQLGLQTYDVLNTAAAAAVVIDGNVRSQALIEDVEATEASIRRLHGLDAGQKIIHYFDPRSDRHELSFMEADGSERVSSRIKYHALKQSSKMSSDVIDSETYHYISNLPDRSKVPDGIKTKGERVSSRIKYHALKQSSKMSSDVIDSETNPCTPNLSDGSKVPEGTKTKGTRLTAIRMVRKRKRSIRYLSGKQPLQALRYL